MTKRRATAIPIERPTTTTGYVLRIKLGIGLHTSLIEQGSTKMYRQTIIACVASCLSAAAQGTLARLPSSSAGASATCSRLGEVLRRDVFAQTFLLKLDVGQIETVPFSRWTGFFKVSSDLTSGRAREIEPTDIRLGDRLCMLLDPSQGTATTILVVERAPSKLATSMTSDGGGAQGLLRFFDRALGINCVIFRTPFGAGRLGRAS